MSIGSAIDELDTPRVVIDLDVLERNVERMAQFARERKVQLRPHAKSHKTVEVAMRQRTAGCTGLTVAKLDEAEAFLNAGFADLFIANEVVGVDKWYRLARLQQRGRVAVGIDSALAASGLDAIARANGVEVPVLIEVDSGLGRAGVTPGAAALALAEHLADLKGLQLRGLFTHAGHAYGAASREEVARIGRLEGELLVESAEVLRAHGINCEVVSVGSTPTALHSGAVAGVTEIRPGNYVFYDRMQVGLGVASLDDCSLSVLARVISRPRPDRAVLDAGSKTFALDRGAHGMDALAGYGQDRQHGLILERLSEEHAVVGVGDQIVDVGDRLRIVPNHACTVTNLADELLGVRADRVCEVMPVLVRGGGR
ncbi:MAG TPA: alanine racemase [Chloroflexota bacterium]|jgi:D-serine deaminase-like pyridoxal phosphate-dependent protein